MQGRGDGNFGAVLSSSCTGLMARRSSKQGVFSVIDTLAVVGATGAVGRIILQLLAERDFPARRIKFLASGRSAGSKVTYRGKEQTVELLEPDSFNGVDIAI